MRPKEGCNWGHGLSAAIKLGSLEKTVGTCLLRSGVYYEQSFSCRKNCTTQPFAFVGDSPVFFRSFATFFGKTISWSGAKQRFCFTGCRSVWDQTAITWAPGFLAWGQLTSHALNCNLPYSSPLLSLLLGKLTGQNTFSNFSCRFLNPNNFSQFQF